jgi:hypothetical protein
MRCRPPEQRRAFINLVKRIGTDHHRVGPRRVDHRLGEGKQCFAAAVHGDDLALRIHGFQAITPLQPLGDRHPQRLASQRRRVAGEAVEVVGKGLLDEFGSGVLRLADVKSDWPAARVGRCAIEQRAQFLERVALQALEVGIHAARPKGPNPATESTEISDIGADLCCSGVSLGELCVLCGMFLSFIGVYLRASAADVRDGARQPRVPPEAVGSVARSTGGLGFQPGLTYSATTVV